MAEDAVKGATESANRAAAQTRLAQEAFKEILAAEEAGAVARNLERMSREQQQVIQQAETQKADPKNWEKMARREGVAVRETKQLEDTLKELAQLSPVVGPAAQIQQALQNARTPVEKAIAERAQDQAISTPANNLGKTFIGWIAEWPPPRSRPRKANSRRRPPKRLRGP